MKTIEQEIRDKAYEFLGQEEIRGNMGFKDERFQELMEIVSWQKKQAWCIYFTELVWRLAYSNQNSLIADTIEELFSGSAIETLNNFKKSRLFNITNRAKVGSIAVWQRYYNDQPHWSGHGGIVVKAMCNHFHSIEGNTNDDGDREGYEVALKIRRYDFNVKNGLRLKGFINPISS
jgi:hypothetical protein